MYPTLDPNPPNLWEDYSQGELCWVYPPRLEDVWHYWTNNINLFESIERNPETGMMQDGEGWVALHPTRS